MAVEQQIAILYATINGYLDGVATEDVRAWEEGFHTFLDASGQFVLEAFRAGKGMEPEIEAALKQLIQDYQATRKS
jgi:F-type H+-transporting ATPase subunit alpha